MLSTKNTIQLTQLIEWYQEYKINQNNITCFEYIDKLRNDYNILANDDAIALFYINCYSIESKYITVHDSWCCLENILMDLLNHYFKTNKIFTNININAYYHTFTELIHSYKVQDVFRIIITHAIKCLNHCISKKNYFKVKLHKL